MAVGRERNERVESEDPKPCVRVQLRVLAVGPEFLVGFLREPRAEQFGCLLENPTAVPGGVELVARKSFVVSQDRVEASDTRAEVCDPVYEMLESARVRGCRLVVHIVSWSITQIDDKIGAIEESVGIAEEINECIKGSLRDIAVSYVAEFACCLFPSVRDRGIRTAAETNRTIHATALSVPVINVNV